MLKKYLDKGKEAISGFISKLRVGGFTVPSMLKKNRQNTVDKLFDDFKSAVMSDVGLSEYSEALEKAVKTRKRATLNTLKNIMSAVRGRARAILSAGRKGKYWNVSVLDEKTTHVCQSHIGMSWALPYDDIPNKPPRIPPVHPCRSYLLFRAEGDDAPVETPFIDQFNADESLRRELLGATRFEAYKSGKLTITSFAQFERVVLTTLEDLNLK